MENPFEGKASVSIEADDLCTRFTARVVTDVKVEHPHCGCKTVYVIAAFRPINNVVDVTKLCYVRTWSTYACL